MLRTVHPRRRAEIVDLIHSPIFQSLVNMGVLNNCRELQNEANLFEQPRIWFPSFPQEWPPEMLHDAGQITLDLSEKLLPAGYWLKDATPSNILYRGAKGIFIDLLSIVPRPPKAAMWHAYAQFLQTFLYPLIAVKWGGLELDQIFTTRRDGLSPEQMARVITGSGRLRMSVAELILLPRWMSRGTGGTYSVLEAKSAPEADFVIGRLYRGLRKHLKSVKPAAPESEKLHYDAESYTPAQRDAKRAFVTRSLAHCKPRRVLDIGANTGEFSRMAAAAGASVVAIDNDPAVVGAIYRRAQKEDLEILALRLDIARPTAGTGWENREQASFLERAGETFDLILMLAVVHHLVLTEGVPLERVIDLAHRLTARYVLIEEVTEQDPMFQKLARGRDGLVSRYAGISFRAICELQFEILDVEELQGGSRRLYLLRKK